MSTNNNPLVTVLLPAFNADKYLSPAIESILSQTFSDFEFLIINDGSSDHTEEIILSYKDSRIKYVKNKKNLGLITTLNKGLELAKGKYIARMDADDIAMPKRLEKQFNFMEKHNEVGLCGSFLKNIGDQDNNVKFETEDAHIRFRLLFSTYLRHPTAMLRQSVLLKHNIIYRSTYKHVEDHKMWIEVSRYSKLAILPEVLLQYRVHEYSISKSKNREQAVIESLIRKEQLLSLGISVTNTEEMELYNSFLHLVRFEWNPYLKFTLPENFQQYVCLSKLLNKIVIQNRLHLLVSPLILEKKFGKAFFKLSLHTTAWGLASLWLFLKHPLSKSVSFTNIQLLKLFIKSLLKKKYDINELLLY